MLLLAVFPPTDTGGNFSRFGAQCRLVFYAGSAWAHPIDGRRGALGDCSEKELGLADPRDPFDPIDSQDGPGIGTWVVRHQ
jgi:hypothetical protein